MIRLLYTARERFDSAPDDPGSTTGDGFGVTVAWGGFSGDNSMKDSWLKLAGELLDRASEEFSNHGCNDWDFPPLWTDKEKKELLREMHKDNNSLAEWKEDGESLHPPPDWWVMVFLADGLKRGK